MANFDPWLAIGWFIVTVVVVLLLLVIVGLLIGVFLRLRFRLKAFACRNIAPVEGQLWERADGTRYRIRKIYDNGNLSIQASSASWGESKDEWMGRVRREPLLHIKARP